MRVTATARPGATGDGEAETGPATRLLEGVSFRFGCNRAGVSSANGSSPRAGASRVTASAGCVLRKKCASGLRFAFSIADKGFKAIFVHELIEAASWSRSSLRCSGAYQVRRTGSQGLVAVARNAPKMRVSDPFLSIRAEPHSSSTKPPTRQRSH
jgi:hypothetical protein